MTDHTRYETVIGLEVHLQLNTRTKTFCGCSIKFGAEPNTQVCPVCLGLPGSLPVFNREVLNSGIKVALSLGCDIQKTMKFDRKNYYYPDLPKNYQISQYDQPLSGRGKIGIKLEDGTRKEIGITRVHIEEDAGKLLHSETDSYSLVDLNRTGTPLLEIVSEPDMRSPYEAYEYLVKLKQVLKYLDVSDCNMEEGSLRCDANISIRKRGAREFGKKVEIKNMNSFKAVREGLLFEEERQREELEEGRELTQETRLWDEDKRVTVSMRSKEASHDYRYFPEPDLVPFEISADLVDGIRRAMPEGPEEKKIRFAAEYGMGEKDIEVLTAEKDIADLFEGAAGLSGDRTGACNWVKGEVMMHLKERETDVKGLKLSPGNLAQVIKLAGEGKISNLVAKEVLRESIDTGRDPYSIVKDKGLEQVSNADALGEIVSKVIRENERSVSDFRKGKDAALGFLVGQVMKLSGGKANPKVAGELLRKALT
ncbi:MAG: Asp-tRNA(Asn)/Glu-tRNA(Gln) amidotransferase subunit GatB [Candidatus Omnitrophica bacterium]|nr:Asp-tRNA(Asn)/Glu-tRNA(Gln) amidotransferase subunit GatB [Candidatus Omnitrophota bacterium]